MSLPLFLLLAAGIQYALGGDHVVAPLRKPLPALVRALLECPACAGFWIGLGLSAGGFGPPELADLGWPAWIHLPAAGLVAAVGVPAVRFFGPDSKPKES